MAELLINSLGVAIALLVFIGGLIGAYVNLRTRDAAQQATIEILQKDLIKAERRIDVIDRRHEENLALMFKKMDEIIQRIGDLRVELQNKQDRGNGNIH